MKRTPLYEEHLKSHARMVEFGGWEMPLNFPSGIISEHLATRKWGGLFDISHMGRFSLSGEGALPFLQYVLTGNAAALPLNESQYTIIPNEAGGAIDDAYLYRLGEKEFLLVVNAANAEKDWAWLNKYLPDFPETELKDRTAEVAMLALQGAKSKEVLAAVLGDERKIPPPLRNTLIISEIFGAKAPISRTGYTGEPVGFEIFPPRDLALPLSRRIQEIGKAAGIVPVGLGARDTLRLEAGLPLYGNELGKDVGGGEVPIFALPAAKIAVSFARVKGDFIGRAKLWQQFGEVKSRQEGLLNGGEKGLMVPRMVMPVALSGAGIARPGFPVRLGDKIVGNVTSGTAIPYWEFEEGAGGKPSSRSRTRAICLAYLDSHLKEGQPVSIQVRERAVAGVIVKRFLSGQAPPYARSVAA